MKNIFQFKFHKVYTVSEGEAVKSVQNTDSDNETQPDVFTYGGKTYLVEVSGKKKFDDVRETKYEYDGKNQLIAFTDPEGRRETYTYDVSCNLTKTVDKNGNIQKNAYD